MKGTQRKIKSIGSISALTGAMFLAFARPVAAADTVLPAFFQKLIDNITGGGGALKYTNDKLRSALTILMVVIFLVGIVYSALAGVKFITSQGNSDKIEESKGAVKAILMGFAAMIIAVIGILLVLAFVGVEQPGTIITF